MDVLRFISQLFMCNYMQAKVRLSSELIITDKSLKIRDIARNLNTFGLTYTITPDFPYAISLSDYNDV